MPQNNFLVVLGTVFVLTVLSIMTALAIVLFGHNPLTSAELMIIDNMMRAFQIGLGTILGLLGGRALERPEVRVVGKTTRQRLVPPSDNIVGD